MLTVTLESLKWIFCISVGLGLGLILLALGSAGVFSLFLTFKNIFRKSAKLLTVKNGTAPMPADMRSERRKDGQRRESYRQISLSRLNRISTKIQEVIDRVNRDDILEFGLIANENSDPSIVISFKRQTIISVRHRPGKGDDKWYFKCKNIDFKEMDSTEDLIKILRKKIQHEIRYGG